MGKKIMSYKSILKSLLKSLIRSCKRYGIDFEEILKELKKEG